MRKRHRTPTPGRPAGIAGQSPPPFSNPSLLLDLAPAALVENAPDAVVGETLEGIISSWNPGAERLFGYPPAEAIGRHISMLVPPGHSDEIPETIRRIKLGEIVQRIATDRIRKDGRRITVSLAVCPIRASDGRIVGLTKIAHDITERRQALEALQKSEENLRVLFNSVLDGMLLHNAQGAILDANESWCRMHGVTLEQAKRLSVADLSDPSMDMQAARELWSKVLAGETLSFEWKSRRAGDRSEFDAKIFLRCIQLNGQDLILANVRDITPVPDAAGAITHFIAIKQDVTARKQAEQALRENERRLRAMFDHAGVGIVEVAGNDHFIAANARACGILGRSLEEILRMSVRELTWPEDRELSDRLNTAVHAGATDRVSYEKRYIRGDGSPVLVHVTVSAVRDEQGQWVRSITTVEDITERKRAEDAARRAREELAQANAQLESKVRERTSQLVEANASLQTFVYTAAHDLRSPLRSISAFSKIALSDYSQQLGAEGQSLLQRVTQAADQMGRLLNDLLEYSKLSQAELQLQPVLLSEAVNEALGLLEEDIRNKQADISIQRPLPRILGHPATVTLVITNFVCNALKFIPQGVRPRIIIRAESLNSFVRLSVEDNGIGIAPEHQARLFQIFQRLHGKSAYPGTGLGLAIVRRAVERMGGQVGVKSAPGQGSSFWADLKSAP